MPKTQKNLQYILRIPAETLYKLKYIAEYNDHSANEEMEQLILNHIEKFESIHDKINYDDSYARSLTSAKSYYASK